jgi:membrane protein implicated in regulation of membrane protease activity
MRWLFAALLLVEVAALAVALRWIPRIDFANEAILIVAVNGALLVLVWKQLKKRPDCCS